MANWNLGETTLGLAQDEQYQVAVLPVGATEAHGLHLPYATDTIMVERLGRLACERAWGDGAKVLLLPGMPFGINENTLGFKWTISLCPSTLFQVVTDIVSSVEEHGIPVEVRASGWAGNQTLSVDRVLIRPGECVTFRWRVEGVKACYVPAENEPRQDHGVAGVAEKQVCLGATTTYCLRVVKPDDSLEIHYMTVTVAP